MNAHILLLWCLPKQRKIPAFAAGYHPVFFLLQLNPAWNVLLPAKRDRDL